LFLYSSTGGQIYGHPHLLPIPEDHPTRPISAYGVVKLAMEHSLRVFGQTRDLPYLIVRVSNPYGPYQEQTNRHGAVPAVMQALLADRAFTVYGRGDTVRDYIHVDDRGPGVSAAPGVQCPQSSFNIGAGQGASLANLIKRIEDLSGKKLKTVSAPIRASDILSNVLDCARLQKPRAGSRKSSSTAAWP